MGLTREIGEFVAGMRFERVPPSAIDTVCRGFTDCVGVMLAGLSEPVASVVAKSVGLPDPFVRLADFGTATVPAPDLALIYGTAAHALDYDDTGLNGHPSAVLVPAILAEAQEVGSDVQKSVTGDTKITDATWFMIGGGVLVVVGAAAFGRK